LQKASAPLSYYTLFFYIKMGGFLKDTRTF
jgi:hypothetical protein